MTQDVFFVIDSGDKSVTNPIEYFCLANLQMANSVKYPGVAMGRIDINLVYTLIHGLTQQAFETYSNPRLPKGIAIIMNGELAKLLFRQDHDRYVDCAGMRLKDLTMLDCDVNKLELLAEEYTALTGVPAFDPEVQGDPAIRKAILAKLAGMPVIEQLTKGVKKAAADPDRFSKAGLPSNFFAADPYGLLQLYRPMEPISLSKKDSPLQVSVVFNSTGQLGVFKSKFPDFKVMVAENNMAVALGTIPNRGAVMDIAETLDDKVFHSGFQCFCSTPYDPAAGLNAIQPVCLIEVLETGGWCYTEYHRSAHDTVRAWHRHLAIIENFQLPFLQDKAMEMNSLAIGVSVLPEQNAFFHILLEVMEARVSEKPGEWVAEARIFKQPILNIDASFGIDVMVSSIEVEGERPVLFKLGKHEKALMQQRRDRGRNVMAGEGPDDFSTMLPRRYQIHRKINPNSKVPMYQLYEVINEAAMPIFSSRHYVQSVSYLLSLLV